MSCTGIMALVCFSLLAGWIEYRLLRDARRMRLETRRAELMVRHAELVRAWQERLLSGVVPTRRTVNLDSWVCDLLYVEDPTPEQLEKAAAAMDDLDREPWMFLN